MDRSPTELERQRDLWELRRSALESMCVVSGLLAFVWAVVSAIWSEMVDERTLVIAPVALLISSLSARIISERRSWLRTGLFLLGLCVAFMPILSGRDSLSWMFTPVVPVIVSGLIVSPLAGVVLATLVSLLMWLGQRQGLLVASASDLYAALSVIWLAAATGWFSARSLYTALGWALHSQRVAQEATTEARDRRQALRQAVDSLNTTHGILKQSLSDLSAARAEAERAKQLRTEFAANISHELRTPLNIILGFTEIMTRSPEVYGTYAWPQKLHSDVFEVRRNARYLSQFVDDILDLARLDAMRMPISRQITDLRPIIRSCIALVERLLEDKPVALRVDAPDDLPSVPMDETRIRQVILNLLINACRFTSQGSITVQARARPSDLLVSVIDTGQGIPPDRREQIFNKFEQAGAWRQPEASGKGLGLALAKELVHLHDGEIWVESQPGEGSTFSFTLPLVTPNTGRLRPAGEHNPQQAGHTPRVLVVDPDEASLRFLNRNIEGYAFANAPSVASAQERIPALRPRCVIHNVPPNGERQEPSHLAVGGLPTVTCSLPTPLWITDNRQIAAFLTKPVSSEDLISTLSQHAPEGPVLVVDDDPGFVGYVSRALEAVGQAQRVHTAYTGAEAMAKAKQVRPTLILLDMILPEMNGLEVIDALREDEILRQIPVVLLSGARMTQDDEDVHGELLQMVQPGGFTGEQLIQVLKSALMVAAPAQTPPLRTDREPVERTGG